MIKSLPGMGLSRADLIKNAQELPLNIHIEKAIDLLKCYEPKEGYILCFSGGKDSIVIKQLAIMGGVKFKAFYNQTTIDPPDLIYFIRKHHPETVWRRAEKNLVFKMLDKTSGPPTRRGRWCCEIYKERHTEGVKVIGVRAAESPKRAANWNSVSLKNGSLDTVCPILHWTDEHIWEFINKYNLPYCSLYDEGFKRLGCIGCPMGGRKNMLKEFERWPGFKRLWQTGFKLFWKKYEGTLNRYGQPRWFHKFKNWQELWRWWLCENDEPDECQGRLF